MVFKKYFKKLSNHKIDFRFANESDNKTVGETYDLVSGIAETTVHTVTIGTVCPGNGNLAVPDGNDIGAGLVGDGEFLVLMQVDGPN